MTYVLMLAGILVVAFVVTGLEYSYKRQNYVRFADWWELEGRTLFIILLAVGGVLFAFLAMRSGGGSPPGP